MPITVSILIRKDVDDIDKGNDFVKEVTDLVQGHVTADLISSLSNHNPPIELTQEQESE